MANTTRHKLAGALAVALMISLGGPAFADGDDERSPTGTPTGSATWAPSWAPTMALGNILHGLANALNGPENDRRPAAAPASGAAQVADAQRKGAAEATR